MGWQKVRKINIATPDGDVEGVALEKDENGNFRIKNDFGNIVFEFERMSAYEVFKKFYEEIDKELEDELNNSWVDYDDDEFSEEPTVYDYDDCDYTD